MVVQKERTELMEAARTMIQGFNKNLWAEAVITAAYVLNRTGTSSIKDKTPYQLWFNKDFNKHILKPFGSRLSVHVPKETRLKWDAKNQLELFLGYGEDTKGFRIFLPKRGKVQTHRDVIFLPDQKHRHSFTYHT